MDISGNMGLQKDTELLFHLRIHLDKIDFKDILEFIKEKCKIVLLVKELGERPHLHSIVSFNQTKSTFCQQMLKKFPVIKGNGSYSCVSVKKKDELVHYLLKGNDKDTLPDVIVNSANLDVKQYHTEYWEVNQKIVSGNKGLQKDTEIVVKKKSPSWSEKVFTEFCVDNSEHYIAIQTFHMIYKPTDFEKEAYNKSCLVLYKHMLRCLGKSRKKLSDFIKRDIYNGFINAIVSENDTAFDVYCEKDFKKVILNNI